VEAAVLVMRSWGYHWAVQGLDLRLGEVLSNQLSFWTCLEGDSDVRRESENGEGRLGKSGDGASLSDIILKGHVDDPV
jgi:hypothetical protein